jgi:hypothetical protein
MRGAGAPNPLPKLATTQVLVPVDYARVVQRIGNEMDLTQVSVLFRVIPTHE